MSHRAAAWLAWSMWAISLPFAAFGGGVLGFLSASARNFPSLGKIVLLTLLALTFTTVGAVVASRRPDNPIGWIFCAGCSNLDFRELRKADVQLRRILRPRNSVYRPRRNPSRLPPPGSWLWLSISFSTWVGVFWQGLHAHKL
jgi:hypothetical protein